MSLLVAKDAIREVLAEYCFRLDGGDYDGMAALFTEDGTWDTAFGKGTGRAAIAQLARDIRARAGDTRPRAIHLVTNIAITLAGDTRRGALELDRRAEQPRRAENRLGRRLCRPDGQAGRRLAVPLPQDRPLHRRLTGPLPSHSPRDLVSTMGRYSPTRQAQVAEAWTRLSPRIKLARRGPVGMQILKYSARRLRWL